MRGGKVLLRTAYHSYQPEDDTMQFLLTIHYDGEKARTKAVTDGDAMRTA